MAMNNDIPRLAPKRTPNYLFCRIAAFSIDMFIICYPFSVIRAIFLELIGDTLSKKSIFIYIFFAAALMMAFWVSKDILRPSIGKRLMRLKIVSLDGKPIPTWKLIVRNFTLGLWPIEAILVVISPRGRITDRLLGLNVIFDDKR